MTYVHAGEEVPVPNPIFDESGNFVLVPSLLGIKVINITTNSVSRIIGQPENTERFLALALWQGLPKKVGGGWHADVGDAVLHCAVLRCAAMQCAASRSW